MVERLLAATYRDEPAVLALVGEPGIGKTRLLQELRDRGSAAGFQVLSGRGSELEREVPFGLVVDALDEPLAALEPALLNRLGDERIAELAAVLPSIASGSARLSTALEVERYRCHHAVRLALEELVRGHPLLLILDDVHWADPASMELVSHLLRRRVPRSLIALAYRPGPAPRQLLRAIEWMEHEGSLQSLELRPLSLDEAALLLGTEHERATLEALHRESGGIPFYLEQLSRAPARADHPLPVGPAESATATDVPANVRAAIEQELEALSTDARRLVQAAAVAGAPFDLDHASAIADMDEPSAWTALDELTAADVLRSGEMPRQLSFRHPIVRRAVYDAASPGWLLGAHRRAAQTLADRGGAIGVRAHHVERSAAQGDEDAIAVLTDAGHAAASRAPAAAARWFQAALRLLPPDAEPRRRLPLLVALAGSFGAVGRLQDSGAVLTQALELSPPDQRARVVGMIARTEQGRGRSTEARRLLAEGLSVADPGSADSIVLRLALAENRLMGGEWDEAAADGDAAREQAQALGDRALYLAATVFLALSANHRGAIDDTLALVDEAAATVDALPDEQLAPHLDALVTLSYAEISVDRLEASTAHAERGIRLCRATGHGYAFLRFMTGLAAARMIQGRLDEARRASEIATEGALLLDNDYLIGHFAGIRCWIASLQGDADAALASGEMAVQALERVPDALFAGLVKACYGEALIEAGRPEDGRRWLLSAGGPALTGIQADGRPHWHQVLAEAAAATGRLDEAEAMAVRCETGAAALGLAPHLGSARYARACLLLARGQPAEAARVAHSAVEHFDASSWRLEAARARMLTGRALALAGDGAAAVKELEPAHATFVSCGAARLADRAASELRGLGKRVARGAPRRSEADRAPGALTARQGEVAELVARGYTNRQIAEELYVSPRTVENHLSEAFTRLGVSSRAALAAEVARLRSEAAHERSDD